MKTSILTPSRTTQPTQPKQASKINYLKSFVPVPFLLLPELLFLFSAGGQNPNSDDADKEVRAFLWAAAGFSSGDGTSGKINWLIGEVNWHIW